MQPNTPQPDTPQPDTSQPDTSQRPTPRRYARITTAPLLIAATLITLILAGCGGPTTSGQWQLYALESGHPILALADDPTQHALLYAGSDDGHVYRVRADSGSAPQPGAGLPTTARVQALLPDPHAPGVVYAATSVGLYRSADYGDTWRTLGAGLPQAAALSALVFGADTRALYAAAHAALYRSDDSGRTWAPIASQAPQTGSAAAITALLFDPSRAALYAATTSAGVFVIAPSTWEPRSANLPAHVAALAELPTQASGSILFAATATGVYASADGGQGWAPRANGLPTGAAVTALIAAQGHSSWLYAGTAAGVYRSQDSGKSWALVAPGLSGGATLALSADPAAGPHGADIVLASTGAHGLGRYPARPTPAPNPFSAILNILALGVVVVVCAWALRRARLQLTNFSRTTPPPAPPLAPSQPNAPRLPGAPANPARRQDAGVNDMPFDRRDSQN